jgi:hypothetical protein
VVRFPIEATVFTSKRPELFWALPASYSVGTGALFCKTEQPRYTAVHAPPHSAEVKNAWSYIPTSSYVFVMYRDSPIVKPTRCTSFSNNLFLYSTLHVSDGLSVHHQEFRIVHTATDICQTDTATCLLEGMSSISSPLASR